MNIREYAKNSIKGHYKSIFLFNALKNFIWSWIAPPIPVDYNKKTPFLFIVGSGRSGNTLLRRLMMEYLSIYMPPETYVLPIISDYRILGRALGWSSTVDLVISAFEYHPEFKTFNKSDLREYAVQAKKWKYDQTLTNLILGLYSWLAKQEGMDCAWLGDKTPWNTLHIYKVDKIMPRSKYIYLLRDGVDVAVSYLEAGIYNDIKEAGKRWARSHRTWLTFKKSLKLDSYIELRYEDLVQNHIQTIHDIALKFSIPQNENRKNVIDLLGDATIYSRHSNALMEPSSKSIGKGRKRLTHEQRKKLKPIINNLLITNGYKSL